MKFVLFGSTGDLARLKILPALIDLQDQDVLGENFELIAVGRRNYDLEDFKEFLRGSEMHPFKENIDPLNPTYVQVNFDESGGFDNLWQHIGETNEQIVIYLSLGYEIVELTLERFLDVSGSEFFAHHEAIISVEKPFGGNYDQACQFNKILTSLVGGQNIFRNDHVIFKKAILALDDDPAAEAKLLELMYGAEKMTVIYSEQVNVGDRVGFYDGKGVTIDMFQSHLLQIAAMALHQCNLNNLKDCKARFIDNLEIIPESIIRSQYESYSQAEQVDPNLQTETFFRATFKSNLPEFENTKFEFASGKSLDEKSIKIIITHPERSHPDEICIEPCHAGQVVLPSADGYAYQRLITALIKKDQTHFVSLSEIEAQWLLTEKVRTAMQSTPLTHYPDGANWQGIDFTT